MAQQTNITAVQWLYNKMYEHRGNITIEEYEQAKQMEKEQKEISDEEIYKEAEKHYRGLALTRFVQGAKWYRKQLKKKQ